MGIMSLPVSEHRPAFMGLDPGQSGGQNLAVTKVHPGGARHVFPNCDSLLPSPRKVT